MDRTRVISTGEQQQQKQGGRNTLCRELVQAVLGPPLWFHFLYLLPLLMTAFVRPLSEVTTDLHCVVFIRKKYSNILWLKHRGEL